MIARSSPECHLYMELHPCTCGEARGPTQHKLVLRDDGLASLYEGPCPRCETTRTFEFLLDPEIPPVYPASQAEGADVRKAQVDWVKNVIARDVDADVALRAREENPGGSMQANHGGSEVRDGERLRHQKLSMR